MAGRYPSVYFPYLNHNVSVKTEKLLSTAKAQQFKDKDRPSLSPGISRQCPPCFHDIVVCTGQSVHAMCWDQGRKKSRDTA